MASASAIENVHDSAKGSAISTGARSLSVSWRKSESESSAASPAPIAPTAMPTISAASWSWGKASRAGQPRPPM